ncbi:MAG TPA: amino acid permease, partial [Casimicrobiaceae bacterium]
MAREGELPRTLAAVDPVHRVPHHAEIAVGLVVCLVVAVADVRDAIGFSAFCVLVYYAIANASAWTLGARRALPAVGLVGCLVLAFTLPTGAVLAGLAVLAAGLLARR